MSIEAIRAASARVTAAGQPYEVIPQTIDGVAFRVFKNAPANLRELYRSSLVHADKDFYVYQDERYTFDQSWRQAARVAHRLVDAGVKQGDRVGIAARNYPEWLFAFMGITSIGAVAVTMNAWWSSEELAYGIDDSGLEFLFADAERLERVLPLCATRKLRLIAIRADHVAAANRGVETWQQFVDGASETMPERTWRRTRTQRSSTRRDRLRTRKACWPRIAASFMR